MPTKNLKGLGILTLGIVVLAASCANPTSTPATATASSAKALSSFGLVAPAVSGTINEVAKTVGVTVPNLISIDSSSLVATFTTTGTGVIVGGVAQVSGTTVNDFAGPVTYVVTAADGSTAGYTVAVTHSAFALGTLGGVMTTLAGSSTSEYGTTDGTGINARFSYPSGLAGDGTNLYVSDTNTNLIRKIVISTGVVTTLAGSGATGSTDGTGTAASFNGPFGLATDGVNLYVADSSNSEIRKIVISTGVVTTLAGSSSNMANGDGTGATAGFGIPTGLALFGNDLYVVDNYNGNIRKIVTTTGVVTTPAITGVTFTNIAAVTTDGTNLFIPESHDQKVYKIVIATGVASVLAGSGATGSHDATGTSATFSGLFGVTTDGTSLYVIDGSLVRQIGISSRAVTTLVVSAAGLSSPTFLATNGKSLFVADSGNNAIKMIQ
jgi:hypothetical protein